MLKFLSFILKILFNLIKSKKSLLVKLAILEKEVEILNRQRKKRLQFLKTSPGNRAGES